VTDTLIEKYSLDKALQKQSHKEFKSVAEQLQNWTIKKTYSTLGYGAAEV